MHLNYFAHVDVQKGTDFGLDKQAIRFSIPSIAGFFQIITTALLRRVQRLDSGPSSSLISCSPRCSGKDPGHDV